MKAESRKHSELLPMETAPTFAAERSRLGKRVFIRTR